MVVCSGLVGTANAVNLDVFFIELLENYVNILKEVLLTRL